MAWAPRASATLSAAFPGGGASSFNLGNLGAATVVGDRIIIAIECSMVSPQPSVSGLASTGGGPIGGQIRWARDFAIPTLHGGYFEELSVWSGVCQSSGSVTAITATTAVVMASGTSGLACAASAYSGLAVGNGLGVDQNGVQDLVSGGFASTTGSTTYDSQATLIGTNKANQLVIGVGADAGGSATLTVGSGFTMRAKIDASSTGEVALQDMDSGLGGFPQRSIVTSSVSFYYMAAVIVYRILAGNTQLAARRPAAFGPGIAR